MSTEQPVDPQLIEQTKQQIRALYAEIAQFARSDNITAEQFYAEMLHRMIQALAAVGGVVWAKNEQGQLALQYQEDLQQSRLAEKSEEEQQRHGRLLLSVMASGEGMLAAPNSGTGGNDQAANPTEWLLVLGPLKTKLEVIGVVEIFQRPGADVPIQRGYLRFLLEVCSLASEFLNSRQLERFSDRQLLWTQLEEFTRLAHTSLNPRDTAYTIANEGRRLVECDRVSVAIRKGKKCQIEAVSGQDMVDKRSNTIRLLNRLATVVVASEEPMWYTGDTSDLAPQVEDALQEYVDESHTKMIAVLPLRRPKPPEKDKERPDDPDDTPHPIGALIVEQIEDSRVASRMLSRVEVVTEHSATALANSLEHENIFLMPMWRTLGKAKWVIEARNLPKTVAAAAAVVLAIAALFFVPWELRVHADGSLEPVLRRHVFASLSDAKVAEIKVKGGAQVKAGDVLAVLESFQLKDDILKVEGEIATKKSEVERLGLQYNRATTNEERARLDSDLAKERLALLHAQKSYQVYKKQEADLLVRSPIDGEVMTWNIHDLLNDRPVERGHELFQIGDLSGPYELVVHMPDDRMADIELAQKALRDKVRDRLRVVLREQMKDGVRKKLVDELLAQRPSLINTMTGEGGPAPVVDPRTPNEPAAILNHSPSAAPTTGNPSIPPASDGDGKPSAEESKSQSQEIPPSHGARSFDAQKVTTTTATALAVADEGTTSGTFSGALAPRTAEPSTSPEPAMPDPAKPARQPVAAPTTEAASNEAAPEQSPPAAKEDVPLAKPSGKAAGPRREFTAKPAIDDVPPMDKPTLPGPGPAVIQTPTTSHAETGTSSHAETGTSEKTPSQTPVAPAELGDKAPAEPKPESIGPLNPDIEKQVNEQLDKRLDEAVDAKIRSLSGDQLSAELKKANGEDLPDRLTVLYCVTTDSATWHKGYVKEIGMSADVHGDKGNVVPIKVEIDRNDLGLGHIRAGAGVNIKVECGPRSLGYVLFRDVIAFFHKTWFRWF